MLVQSLTSACALLGQRVCLPAVMSAEPFIDNPSWSDVQPILDGLPVFTLANEDEKPLQYEVNGKPMAIFYADVAAAKQQFDAVTEQNPDLGYDLTPVGVGTAYKLSCEGKAILVPGVTELTAAGMPEGMSPMGQELPLFACMEIKRDTDDGGTVTPLFMSSEDCAATVQDARDAAEGATSKLDIVCLPLDSVVEHLLSNVGAPPTFSFMPPTRSTEHIAKYVGKGVYYRVVDEGDVDGE